jgi:hypothetical protein
VFSPLVRAAVLYVAPPLGSAWDVSRLWPFEPASYKLSDDPIRNLTKAGALIAAEIDRLERTREDSER